MLILWLGNRSVAITFKRASSLLGGRPMRVGIAIMMGVNGISGDAAIDQAKEDFSHISCQAIR